MAVNLLQERKNIREVIAKTERDYNTNISTLLSIAQKKNPDDDKLDLIKTNLATAIRIDPGLLINETGSYIWNFREQIAKRDERFFLDNPFEKEVEEATNNRSVNIKKTDINSIIMALKKTYTNMSAPEKNVVWIHVGNCLSAVASNTKARVKNEIINAQINDL